MGRPDAAVQWGLNPVERELVKNAHDHASLCGLAVSYGLPLHACLYASIASHTAFHLRPELRGAE